MGFVEECFERSRPDFDLVVDDETQLPPWSLENLAAIAHHIFGGLQKPLNEDEVAAQLAAEKVPVPYRISMVGYQVKAFTRGQYPFTPSSHEDAFVPSEMG